MSKAGLPAIVAAFAILNLSAAPAPTWQVQPSLDGTWEITAAIDDGQVLPSEAIRGKLVKDGRLTVAGQKITFTKPTTGEARTLLFVTDTKANPAILDLGNAERTGGKGIFMLAGDTLLICLSGPGIESRPTEFASKAGSHALLMTLRRVNGDTPAIPVPPVAPPVRDKKILSDAEVTQMLIGTWGFQDADKIVYQTLNADGSMSASLTWKKTIKHLFDDDERSSGTWKVKDGTLIVTITASTDRDARGQIYSFRINTITANDIVFFDQNGSVRREWKVR